MLQDIRLALRLFARHRAFTVGAALTLALGISLTTAIFSVVNAILLTPPPFATDPRVVLVKGEQREHGLTRASISWPDARDLAERSAAVEDIAIFTVASFNLAGRDGAQRVRGARVSASFFSLLPVAPMLGRALRPEEGEPGRSRVAVVSERLWRAQLGADPGILGRALTLNGVPHTVVGVMPADFALPGPAELWVPFVAATEGAERGHRFLDGIARLRAGASLEQARREARDVARALSAEFPDSNHGWDLALTPLAESITGRIRPLLLVFSAAGGCVLLIA